MERSLKLIPCDSVKQADRSGRRRATFRPQTRKILAGQMIQYPLNHRRVFDARDDLDRSSALRASFDIYLKNPLEALRPLHRRALLGRCAVFGLG